MRLRPLFISTVVVGSLLAVLTLSSSNALADSGPLQQGTGDEGDGVPPVVDTETDEAQDLVVYELVFFDKYNPVTALDVVSRTPGFSVARTSNTRGFGGAGGNLLIDGQRPSSKSDSVADILSRIPASLVQRVELIRGATGGLDVNGQSIVANVVLREGAGGSGFVEIETRYEAGRVNAEVQLSYSGRFGATDYLLGVERQAQDSKNVGIEQLMTGGGIAEIREEIALSSGETWSGSLRTETTLGMRDTLRLNAQFRTDPGDRGEVSNRFPAVGGAPDVVIQSSDNERESFEVGGDYGRRLGAGARMKVIGLVRREFADSDSFLHINRADGGRTGRRSISSTTNGETIVRAELDWVGGRHTVQMSGERAYNFVDSEFELFADAGEGFVPVDLEGANTRVSERRNDWAVTDSWALSRGWTIDTGLGLEISTISQSGDIINQRTFRFLKPSVAVTYSPDRIQQWRLRFEREIAQLNFFDFVSSADFDDQEVDFGNPELEPEQTWAFEASYERRFGRIGVVELRVFYDSIQDVQDLLPIGGTFEVEGNIGGGTRRGVDFDVTVALDALGLGDSRLELGFLVQESSVTDPVTGRDRSLSGERDFRGRISYRQEFPAHRLSWGASVFDSSERRFYGVDELESSDSEMQLTMFLEKVVMDGIKIRFEARNLLNRVSRRDRSVFEGSRALGLIRFRELRNRTEGREFSLSLSRTF